MPPQSISQPEDFSTDIATKGQPFNMVCLNVVFDSTNITFFSAHFANVCKSKPTWNTVLTFLHHWLHFFIKFFEVSRYEARKWYSSFIVNAAGRRLENLCLPSANIHVSERLHQCIEVLSHCKHLLDPDPSTKESSNQCCLCQVCRIGTFSIRIS